MCASTNTVKKYTVSSTVFGIQPILNDIIFWLRSCNRCCEASEVQAIDLYETCLRVSEHRRHLLACILVSKTWLEVALPQLWNYHARLKHLVALMHEPSSIEYLTPRKGGGDLFFITPELKPERLERLNFYAKYIKVLRLTTLDNQKTRPAVKEDGEEEEEEDNTWDIDYDSGGSWNDVEPVELDPLESFQEIVDLADRRPLLPNLLSVLAAGQWLNEPTSIRILENAFSSSVQRIVLRFGVWIGGNNNHENPSSTILRRQIELASEKAPGIKELSIMPPLWLAEPISVLDSSITLVRNFRSLSSITLPINWCTENVLDALNQMEKLEMLQLRPADCADSGGSATHSEILQRPKRLSFPYLTDLSISARSFDILKLLRDRISERHSLKNLLLYFRDSPCKMFQSTNSSINFPELERLDLGSHSDDDLVITDILRFAGSNTRLSNLQVSQIKDSDSALDGLIKTWPRLRSISLTGKSVVGFLCQDYRYPTKLVLANRRQTGFTLEALEKLTGLPHLEDLEITILASNTHTLARHQHQAKKKFERLASLFFVSCFPNYAVDGFDPKQAAKYVCSLLKKEADVRVKVELDTSWVQDPELNHHEEDSDYRKYGRGYRTMIKDFRTAIRLYRDQ